VGKRTSTELAPERDTTAKQQQGIPLFSPTRTDQPPFCLYIYRNAMRMSTKFNDKMKIKIRRQTIDIRNAMR
jgi:hypothetical protein